MFLLVTDARRSSEMVICQLKCKWANILITLTQLTDKRIDILKEWFEFTYQWIIVVQWTDNKHRNYARQMGQMFGNFWCSTNWILGTK